MKINLRRGAWGVLFAAALASGVPALSASSVGGVQLTRVGTSGTPFVSDTVDIEWAWQAGTVVRHTSQIALRVTNSVTGRRAINRWINIRDGRYTWDTTQVPDGVYHAEVVVRYATTITSTLKPIYVDNTAPTAEITRPARGSKSVYVNDEAYGADQTVVVGPTSLLANVSDNFSGIASYRWFLDGQEIELSEAGQYDFTNVAPGEHTLSVVARDNTGNESESSPASEMSILVVGAGVGVPDAGELPDPGVPDPSEILPSEDPQVPDPSEILPSEDPQVPDPSEILPSEDPQVPDPNQTPDPGSLLPVPPPL